MIAIAGIIRAGELIALRVNEVPSVLDGPSTSMPVHIRPSALRNSDQDFIAQRDRMQANGDDTYANCINFFAALRYRGYGEMDKVRALGKGPF